MGKMLEQITPHILSSFSLINVCVLFAYSAEDLPKKPDHIFLRDNKNPPSSRSDLVEVCSEQLAVFIGIRSRTYVTAQVSKPGLRIYAPLNPRKTSNSFIILGIY